MKAKSTREITADSFERLCSYHCSKDELMDFFELSPALMEKWCKTTYELTFTAAHKKFTAKGNYNIRKAQYNAALNGNGAILIWLGKQYLNQRDNPEIETNCEEMPLDELSKSLKDLAEKLDKSAENDKGAGK